jgi:hypothetical protein
VNIQAYEIYRLDNQGKPFPRAYMSLARSAEAAARILAVPVDQARGAAAGDLVAEPLPTFVNELFEHETVSIS